MLFDWMGQEHIVIPDGDGSVLLCLHIVAEDGERAETNKFDSRPGDIVDQGTEA